MIKWIFIFFMIFLIKNVMEIKEIISYYLNPETNILEVSFRTIEDSDEQVRNDSIEYDIVSEYGYSLETESFDFFSEEEEDGQYGNEEPIEFDEDELITFLNEYYTVNPDAQPMSEIY